MKLFVHAVVFGALAIPFAVAIAIALLSVLGLMVWVGLAVQWVLA